MSLNELQVIAGFIERAVCPEDVFGAPKGTDRRAQESEIKRMHRQLAKALHPDVHNGDPAAASLAGVLFAQLETFHSEALDRLKAGTYGRRLPIIGRAPIVIKGRYVSEGPLCTGDVADLYCGSLESSSRRGNLVIKAARRSGDNDLLKAEADILAKLRPKLPESTWRHCVPEVFETLVLEDGRRRVNVMERLEGFHDGEDIRQRLPKGVDGRTVAWMWKRLLVLMEWTWKLGFVHGAILPPHVMFCPDNGGILWRDPRKHSIRLIDWCYAIERHSRTRLSAWVPKWEPLYAPEILKKQTLGPWTDLYMGAKTMFYLIGDAAGTRGSPNVEKEITDSLRLCIHADPARRPQSIGKYFEEFNGLLKKVYGAPAYHEFVLPGA